MDDWFTLERIDEDTDVLSEYRHWEETHCYLLRGRERSLLVDTGLGICDIRQAVDRLTDRPVAAAPLIMGTGRSGCNGRTGKTERSKKRRNGPCSRTKIF